jgi:amino acid transporter
MTVLLSIVCSVGAKESATLNNILTGINVLVISFAIVAGSFFASTANFTPFAPFGVSGIFTGAATAFYSYVGFDVIATSAEEAKNPSRNIPIAIVTSLVTCMALYIAVAAVVVLMVPYAQIDTTAPLSQAFALHGATWAQYIIAVGAICGLTTSLVTSIFPMPRIVYAIAQDGLLPPFLGRVSKRFGTPLIATMICGTLAGLLALILDLDALADMMSIGTLIAYTLVACSVLVLRYRQHDDGTALKEAILKYGAVHPLTPAPPGFGTVTSTTAGTTPTATSTIPTTDSNSSDSENAPLVTSPTSGTLVQRGKSASKGLAAKAASAAKMVLSGAGAGADGGHRKSMESPLLSGGSNGNTPLASNDDTDKSLAAVASAAGVGSSDSDVSTPLPGTATADSSEASTPVAPREIELEVNAVPMIEEPQQHPTLMSDAVDHRLGQNGWNVAGFWVLPRWRSGAYGVTMWTCGHAKGNPWSAYSSAAAALSLFCFSFTLASVGIAVLQTIDSLTRAGEIAMYCFIGVGVVVGLYNALLLFLLPQAYPKELSFVTPWSPGLPLVSVAVNIYLLVSLSPLTWARFFVWCGLGFIVYGCYGIRHSKAVVSVSHAVLNMPLPPELQREVRIHHEKNKHKHHAAATPSIAGSEGSSGMEPGYGSINNNNGGGEAGPLTAKGNRRTSLSGGSLEIRAASSHSMKR